MARDFYINGETMVAVKGRSDISIATLTQLGLTDKNGVVTMTPEFLTDDCDVDAWGDGTVDVQHMLLAVNISMTLVHIDEAVLEVCLAESQAGAAAFGTLVRAGTRIGGGVPRFSPAGTAGPNGLITTGNHLIGLNMFSPVQNKPWRYWYTYLNGPPVEIPLGTKRSAFGLNWRSIPYTVDPWNNGQGAQGVVVFDHTLDSP